jgi:hypothetical protein
MDDDFAREMDLARAIAAEIDSLTVEFGPDAASRVAARRKQALAELTQDPRFQSIARETYKDRIALRQQRVDVARKLQSNGVTENLKGLGLLLWDSRLLDFFTANLRRDEKLVSYTGFKLVTNMREFTRDGLKRDCRQVSEMNDLMYAKNYTTDADVHAAEARANQRENPIVPGGRGMVSNTDWPHR